MSSIKVTISVENAQKWYTHGESLAGTVCLDLPRTTNISSIAITLTGTTHVQVTRFLEMGRKYLDHAEEDTSLLDEKRQLFPPSGSTIGPRYTMSSGKHEFPFHFKLPNAPMAYELDIGAPPDPFHEENKSLPPSISDTSGDKSPSSSAGDYSAIKYFLKATVSKDGILGGATKATATAFYYFPFLPSDGNLDRIPTFGVSHTNKSELLPGNNVSGLLSRLKSNVLSHDKSKNCGCVAFEVRSEKLLTPGAKFTMIVESLLTKDAEAMIIRSATFKLVVSTHITARNLQNTDTHKVELLRLDHLNDVFKSSNGEFQEILGGTKLLKIPESVPPTFSTPQIRRSYYIEVKIRFTHSPGSEATHQAIVKQRVWVRSGTLVGEENTVTKIRNSYPQSGEYERQPPQVTRAP